MAIDKELLENIQKISEIDKESAAKLLKAMIATQKKEEKEAASPGQEKISVSEGEELAELLRKKTRDVRYDPRTEKGSAKMPFFSIKWQESANDPAVVVNITSIDRIKGTPEDVMKALASLSRILRNFD